MIGFYYGDIEFQYQFLIILIAQGQGNANYLPSDITPKGVIKKMEHQLLSPIIKCPLTDKRRFQLSWLQEYIWLEYSINAEAAFCYSCRQFGSTSTKDVMFSLNGFNNWKYDKEKNKGFKRHEKSASHIQSMLNWKERLDRMNSTSEVSEQVSSNVLMYRRQYMKKILETARFLVVNELTFRGTYEIQDKMEKFMPRNYTYTSPTIQNEVIEILASAVREQVVDEINNSDVPYFALLVDSTKDRRNRECVSISARYIKDGKAKESLISMETFEELNAEYFASQILGYLHRYGISRDRILCQSYDGANVMKGDDGGAQGIIQRKLDRKIPYIWCLNHKFHLVIRKMISIVTMIRHYFDQLNYMGKFMRRFKVQQLYEGTQILKLIETRWAGHVRATKSVLQNFSEILKALPQVTGDKFEGDDVAEASGILSTITKPEFVFSLIYMEKLLSYIEPVDKILQSREVGYGEARPIIESTLEEIKKTQ